MHRLNGTLPLILTTILSLCLLLLIGCGQTATPTETAIPLPKGTIVRATPSSGTPEQVRPKTPGIRSTDEPGRSFPGQQPGATVPLAPPGSIITPTPEP